MNEIEQFHDGRLLGCELDWASGELVVQIRLHSGEKSVRCLGVKDLSISRQEEWGSSGSVDSLEISDSDNLKELIIEIQSGDILKCRCERVKEI